MNKITDEVLLEYIDGTLSEKEALSIKAAIENDKSIGKRLAELKFADQFMKAKIEEPSQSFTDAVWNKISKPGTAPKFSLNTLLIVLGAMITVVLGSYFMTDSIIDLDISLNVTDKVTDFVKVPEVELPEGINLKVVSQVLLYSISFLILLLLDKAVFRPYFKRRREMFTGT